MIIADGNGYISITQVGDTWTYPKQLLSIRTIGFGANPLVLFVDKYKNAVRHKAFYEDISGIVSSDVDDFVAKFFALNYSSYSERFAPVVAYAQTIPSITMPSPECLEIIDAAVAAIDNDFWNQLDAFSIFINDSDILFSAIDYINPGSTLVTIEGSPTFVNKAGVQFGSLSAFSTNMDLSDDVGLNWNESGHAAMATGIHSLGTLYLLGTAGDTYLRFNGVDDMRVKMGSSAQSTTNPGGVNAGASLLMQRINASTIEAYKNSMNFDTMANTKNANSGNILTYGAFDNFGTASGSHTQYYGLAGGDLINNGWSTFEALMKSMYDQIVAL